MRGLAGVMFVISDNHGGLTHGISRHFQGASWQRCQVHLLRNMLSHSPVKLRSEVAAHAKLVLHAQDMVEARRQLVEFNERFGKSAPRAVSCLEEGFADAMAVMALPDKYRRRLRTTNMQERVNEEIRRRERVIRIFPNDEAALRLIGALLAERNEVWQERLYLEMDEFMEWAAAKQLLNDIGNNVVAMSS
jgi:transposase-like protein